MSRKTSADATPTDPKPPASAPLTMDNLTPLLAAIQSADAEVGRGLSLTTAVQLSRAWINRRHKALGWDLTAVPFRHVGFPHATARNVRQAFDTEDTALVRDLAQTEKGKLFLAQLETIIAGQAPMTESAPRQAPASKATRTNVPQSGRIADASRPRMVAEDAEGAAPENVEGSAPDGASDSDETPTPAQDRAHAPRPVILPRLE